MEAIKALLEAAKLFILYFIGYKTAQSTHDAKVNEAALNEATATLEKQNKVRVKYAKIRNKVPASWDDTTERLPKAGSGKK